MKQKINKMSVVFVVTIFALTGAATGYAMWSQELVIDGRVATGELDWEWVEILAIEDPFCPPPYLPSEGAIPDYNCDPIHGFQEVIGGPGWGPTQKYEEPKNVACGELIQTSKYHLEVKIKDAYPGYWNGVETHVHCLGTIPIKIQEAILSWDEAGEKIITKIDARNTGKVIKIDLNGDGLIDMEFIWGNHFGTQLEPCTKLEISFEFCFLQDLIQEATYQFFITLRAVQWNEYKDPFA
jgi:hypothetical protein